MALPPGRILIMTKARQTDIDKGKVCEIDAYLYLRTDIPGTIEIRLVADNRLIGTTTLDDIVSVIPRDVLDRMSHPDS